MATHLGKAAHNGQLTDEMLADLPATEEGWGPGRLGGVPGPLKRPVAARAGRCYATPEESIMAPRTAPQGHQSNRPIPRSPKTESQVTR